MAKTILFVYPHYPPGQESYGIGTFIYELTRQLSHSNAFNIIVVSKTFNNKEVILHHNLIIHRLPETEGLIERVVNSLTGNYFSHWFFGRRVYSLVRDYMQAKHVDLVEVCDFGGDGYRLISDLSLLTVIRVHGPSFFLDGFNRKSPIFSSFTRFLEKRQFQDAKKVIIPSERFWSALDVGKSVSPKMTFVAPYILLDCNSIPHKLAYSLTGTMRVLFVGRLDVLKGFDTLLKTIDDIRLRFPKFQIHFTCIGQNNMNQDFATMSASVGGNISIEFMGQLNRQSVRRQYREHDVLVLPSKVESVGYVVAEAMAAGLPVVGFDVGIMECLIEDGVTGYRLKNNGNEHMLSKALLKLYGNRELMMQMGIAARKKIQVYTKRSLLQTISLYNGLVEM